MIRKKSKSWCLYQSLRDDMQSGHYAPKTMLPREDVFAKQLGVSRKTVRSAFSLLENDGLIERHRGIGTFVCDLRPIQEVSILIPCSNCYLSGSASSFFNQQITEAAVSSCLRHGSRMTTIIMSPTNSFNNINWHNFSHLDENSLLIIPSNWYHPLYTYLAERKCRTVIFGSIRSPRSVEPPPPSEWLEYVLDECNIMEQGVKLLAESGCRRIAVASICMDDKDDAFCRGYRAGCQRVGQKELFILPLIRDDRRKISLLLDDFYRKNKFDGLIISPRNFDLIAGKFNHQLLGIPEHVKLVIARSYNAQIMISQYAPIVGFDFGEITRQAIDDLHDKKFSGGEKLVKPQLYLKAPYYEENYNRIEV